MGAIDGPCSPCTWLTMNRTHRQRKRCIKFRATTMIDGFCKSVPSLALAKCEPTCCLPLIVPLVTVLMDLRKNCAVSRQMLIKSCSITFRTELNDLRKMFVNFASACFARCDADRRMGNDQKLNRRRCDAFDTVFVFDCTLTDVNLLIVRCKIASFSSFISRQAFRVLFVCVCLLSGYYSIFIRCVDSNGFKETLT